MELFAYYFPRENRFFNLNQVHIYFDDDEIANLLIPLFTPSRVALSTASRGDYNERTF